MNALLQAWKLETGGCRGLLLITAARNEPDTTFTRQTRNYSRNKSLSGCVVGSPWPWCLSTTAT